MKSYFAKLAARATLANVSASSIVNAKKVADPFEDSTLSETTPRLSETAATFRSGDRASTPSTDQTAASEHRRPPVARSESPVVEPVDQSPVFIPNRPRDVRSMEPITETRLEPQRPPAIAENPPITVTKRHVFEADVSETKRSFTPRVEGSATGWRVGPTDETREHNPVEEGDLHERVKEIESRQTVLQRKADVFMQRLFERRETSDTEPETHAKSENQSPLNPEDTLERPVALQPGSRAVQLPERESDQPSLVIGKLTVEVTPAAPQPIGPPQQVVIVRSGRAGSVSAPSSRRFGLGQF